MGEAPMSFRWAGGSYQSASRIMREKLDGTEFFREHEKMMSEVDKIKALTSSSSRRRDEEVERLIRDHEKMLSDRQWDRVMKSPKKKKEKSTWDAICDFFDPAADKKEE